MSEKRKITDTTGSQSASVVSQKEEEEENHHSKHSSQENKNCNNNNNNNNNGENALSEWKDPSQTLNSPNSGLTKVTEIPINNRNCNYKRRRDFLSISFLRRHGLEKFCSKFNINYYRHEDHENLIQFRYDQLNSPIGSEIVQECRGLIVDEQNNFEIVAFPYFKFFNLGERSAASLDQSNGIFVYEKVDGNMGTLYFYQGSWYVASTSRPDGSGFPFSTRPVKEKKSFKQMFWEIWEALKYQLPTNTKMCYMFEMVNPDKPIIVRHDKPNLILHGARDLEQFQEVDPAGIANLYHWNCVKQYQFPSVEIAFSEACKLDPTISEGFVARDCHFNRVKIKGPHYVALSHLVDLDLNAKKEASSAALHMLQVVLTNEASEFLAYFPGFTGLYQQTKQQVDQLCNRNQIHLEQLDKISDSDEKLNKIVELANGHKPDMEILFGMVHAGAHKVKDYLARLVIQTVIPWVKAEKVTVVLSEEDRQRLAEYQQLMTDFKMRNNSVSITQVLQEEGDPPQSKSNKGKTKKNNQKVKQNDKNNNSENQSKNNNKNHEKKKKGKSKGK